MLYIGTVCNQKEYEKTIEACKKKLTIATVIFENSLMDGFKQNEQKIDIISFPMIPVYSQSGIIGWGNKIETLSSGYECKWLRTINIPVLKQISRKINGRKLIKKWLKANRDQSKCILVYSIPPFLAKEIVKLSKKARLSAYAIIPDLPRDMYVNSKRNKSVQWIRQVYLKQSLKYQNEFSGYIYLTEEMHNVVGGDKPYIVVEGIANVANIEEPKIEEKQNCRAIMYAGGLNFNFGIKNLIEAFERIEDKAVELWVFGSGADSEYVKAKCNNNSNIRFFGRRSHDEVLKYERMATLLINPRSTDEEYTKYSFPSKTIEYMLSGTPVLTTKLKGIPEEYLKYVFAIEDNKIESLEEAMNKVLSLKDNDLLKKGREAQEFILTYKNSRYQAKRIIDFITREGE